MHRHQNRPLRVTAPQQSTTNRKISGKIPSTRKEIVSSLKKRLEDAVKMENYETAAYLRDELKKIKK